MVPLSGWEQQHHLDARLPRTPVSRASLGWEKIGSTSDTPGISRASNGERVLNLQLGVRYWAQMRVDDYHGSLQTVTEIQRNSALEQARKDVHLADAIGTNTDMKTDSNEGPASEHQASNSSPTASTSADPTPLTDSDSTAHAIDDPVAHTEGDPDAPTDTPPIDADIGTPSASAQDNPQINSPSGTFNSGLETKHPDLPAPFDRTRMDEPDRRVWRTERTVVSRASHVRTQKRLLALRRLASKIVHDCFKPDQQVWHMHVPLSIRT